MISADKTRSDRENPAEIRPTWGSGGRTRSKVRPKNGAPETVIVPQSLILESITLIRATDYARRIAKLSKIWLWLLYHIIA